jgi:hypothetical protein
MLPVVTIDLLCARGFILSAQIHSTGPGQAKDLDALPLLKRRGLRAVNEQEGVCCDKRYPLAAFDEG